MWQSFRLPVVSDVRIKEPNEPRDHIIAPLRPGLAAAIRYPGCFHLPFRAVL